MAVSTNLRRGGLANSPVILAMGGVPIGVPSSGTIGNNGALSALTALPTTYSSIYLYFPADTIAVGVPAGLYYCVMSSTTAGTIYNNTYTSGIPTIPASPTAFATVGPGAYVQSTSEITVFSTVLPGGTLGINGQVFSEGEWACANTAGNKTPQIKLSTTAFSAPTLSSVAGSQTPTIFGNRGVANKQIGQAVGSAQGFNTFAAGFTYGSVDTTVDQNLTATATIAVATDYLIMERIYFEVRPS